MGVGFGLIGSGYASRTYAAAFARGFVRDGHLVAIAGGGRAPALAREFDADVEPSVEALVNRDDLEAVILGSPDPFHVEQAVLAARAGKHVFTEKPMATSVAGCDRMIAACKEAGVQLGVNKVLRFRDAAMAAKKLIDDGAIGEVRLIQARGSWTQWLFLNDIVDASGRVIIPQKQWALDPSIGSQYLNWGVHATDLLRWFTGSEVTLCFARYRTFGTPPPPDLSAMVTYEFASGVLAQVLMTYELPEPGIDPADVVLVVGSKGIIDCDLYAKVKLGRGSTWEVVAEQAPFDFLADYIAPTRLKGFGDQVQDFTEAIRDNREPAVTGWDGRAAVEMIIAADRSAATGEAIRVPLSG